MRKPHISIVLPNNRADNLTVWCCGTKARTSPHPALGFGYSPMAAYISWQANNGLPQLPWRANRRTA